MRSMLLQARLITPAALAGSLLTLAVACSSDEERPSGDGVTPQGGSGTDTTVGENRPGGSGGGGATGGSGPASAGGTGGASSEGMGGALGLAGTLGAAGTVMASGGNGGSAPADAGGGAPDADTTADGTMTFFVTSRGGESGGDFGGLSGADALCRELAVAVSEDFGRRTWRAYLSTSMVDARTRIGTGPWHNQAGDIIASDLEQLHDQAAGGSLDETWAVNDFTKPLDEQGNQVPNNVHDILTGSEQDGTVATGLTCNDWTSSATDVQGRIGHTNRAGLAGQPPSWNAVHAVGCGPANGNFTGGTVTQGGGRGSIYCFAVINGS